MNKRGNIYTDRSNIEAQITDIHEKLVRLDQDVVTINERIRTRSDAPLQGAAPSTGDIMAGETRREFLIRKVLLRWLVVDLELTAIGFF